MDQDPSQNGGRSEGTERVAIYLQDAHAIRDAMVDQARDVKAYLASPDGRRLRDLVAKGIIVSAPMVARLPWMRVSRLGRFVGMAGGAALIVKLAEVVRDWEPYPDLFEGAQD